MHPTGGWGMEREGVEGRQSKELYYVPGVSSRGGGLWKNRRGESQALGVTPAIGGVRGAFVESVNGRCLLNTLLWTVSNVRSKLRDVSCLHRLRPFGKYFSQGLRLLALLRLAKDKSYL